MLSLAKDGAAVRWNVAADDHFVLNEPRNIKDWPRKKCGIAGARTDDDWRFASDEGIEVYSVATGELQDQLSLRRRWSAYRHRLGRIAGRAIGGRR